MNPRGQSNARRHPEISWIKTGLRSLEAPDGGLVGDEFRAAVVLETPFRAKRNQRMRG